MIAVIGGGPAGAMAAAGLASRGREVVVFDEKLAWEKPCGGGVTDKALQQYPFLREATRRFNAVNECELTSPGGRRVLLKLDRSVAIYARRELNGLLLERARKAGAAMEQERVVGLRPEDGAWRLELRGGGSATAGAVAIAAGARNGWRSQFPSAAGANEWMATAGYYLPLERLPWPRQRMAIQFLDGIAGYIWSFPRGDHASVGVCGPLGNPPTAVLRQRLEQWLTTAGVEWRGAEFYGHLLPAPSARGLRTCTFDGAAPAAWALVGDAAGLVDPITGEGLYYALRSGELLAEAWGGGESYTECIRRELVPELAAAAAIAPRFYGGRFLGAPVVERMAQFTGKSSRFRSLMCDLFSGSQGYLDLRRRLYRQLAPTLWQIATT